MDQVYSIHYFRVTDLWKKLCEAHQQLLELTFDEYSLLLGSQIEELEEKIEDKNELIAFIAKLDHERKEAISLLNKDLKNNGAKQIQNVADLIITMKDYESKQDQHHLRRFNALLIDIIEKIQAQNKKNQLFINKALMSLREIREDAVGKKNYSTYNAKGASAPGRSA
ncbi:MAG: hypothetical protein COW01_01285 [Bdellovibrionales bacterium CG12_big_fil_rev_8_21_14_0_65_38_15]|nr:MAG: hypothetical protein COW79_03335 [Bdellovibrionales bacterium CG22_combo_CG10-13_8_21_14_all_38_13]PIQ57266.1 MAG: hypothetical protein COW01_01285 [Bdellovibrionales bacterium CG12_big_fil_rev_8_21_14_0_65_38_15]PIR29672.1 MAG: hypothetical protein COV38_09580 [Bdellovibrionales bacterium CG11_big_fil_rev_8_21_14_0_20_38_13]